MTISFSGLTFQIQLLYPGTERFFAGFLTDSPSYTACLRVTQEDLRQAACYCPADASPEFLETVALRRRLADLLLSHDRCLFHSAAMVFREQAYLFAAPQRHWEDDPAEPLAGALSGGDHHPQWRQAGPTVPGHRDHCSPCQSLAGEGISGWHGVGASGWDHLPTSEPGGPVGAHAAWGCHSSHAGPVFLHRPDGRALSAPAAAAQAAGVCNPIWLLENRGGPESARLCHDRLLERRECVLC